MAKMKRRLVPQARAIVSAMARIANALSELRQLLLASAPYRHPMSTQVSRACSLETTILISRFYELVGSSGRNPPEVPLELLERAFLILRRQAEEALEIAKLLEGKRSRDAMSVKKDAQRLVRVTKESAKVLAATMRARGSWSQGIVEDLDLERWL